ncbi:MAG: hypothetical protein AABX33_08680 [Nanoarchaeota archaeon]
MQTKDISYVTLSLDGEYGGRLVSAVNRRFFGTQVQIPRFGWSNSAYVDPLSRMAAATLLYKDPEFKGYTPITPNQSGAILAAGERFGYPEVLGFVLYGSGFWSRDIENRQECEALYRGIKDQRRSLGLSRDDLRSKLLVINPGLEKKYTAPNGISPVVLPGLTKVLIPEVLELPAGLYMYDRASDNGLPAHQDLGKGQKSFIIPDDFAPGLWALIRGGGDIGNIVLSLRRELKFDREDLYLLQNAPNHGGLAFRMTMSPADMN